MSHARIKISWPKGAECATLEDTPTVRVLVAALPLKAKAQTWGEEVYFEIPFAAKLEADAKQVVPPGTVVALLGPSGSGKTTLLRAVAGLETPHRGTIRLGDAVFFDAAREIELPAEARGLGLVFQSYARWPHRTVFDNVAYGLKLRGVSAAGIKASREGAGVNGHASRRPLSAPVVRRPAAAAALARALVCEPPIILLDEPLSNLDANCARRRRGVAADRRFWPRRAHRHHDQIERWRRADRITLLNGGVIEQEGSPTDLSRRRQPCSRPSSGNNNRLDGTLVEVDNARAVIEVIAPLAGAEARAALAPRRPVSSGSSAC
jgi:iron(III) transport system ATP-binding protein